MHFDLVQKLNTLINARAHAHLCYQDMYIEYEFSLPSSIRGHHIYPMIWKLTIREELTCTREPRNVGDRYAVAVVKENGR